MIKKGDWEWIATDTYRLRVWRGWLVKTIEKHNGIAVGVVYIEDKWEAWEIKN